MMKFKIDPISILLLWSCLLLGFSGNAQVFSDKNDRQLADQVIDELKNGILIVPLMKHSNKMNTLYKFSIDTTLSEKEREKMEKRYQSEKLNLDEFNAALIQYFTTSFEFCEAVFVENDQLKSFDASNVIFVNPANMTNNEATSITDKNYFFLKYYQASGIATDPKAVRMFFIADKNFKVLNRPFPTSPGRQSSFKLRIRDLLNLSPNTNDLIGLLVTKLNDNLDRYFIR